MHEALDILRVDRIDRGNRALEDAALTQRLVKDEGITLTVCPLSNLKLCVVMDLKDHPMKRMLQLGLKATCNSDDPAYFGGYLRRITSSELRRRLGLTRDQIVTLAKNSFTGSFLDAASVAKHVATVDAWASAN